MTGDAPDDPDSDPRDDPPAGIVLQVLCVMALTGLQVISQLNGSSVNRDVILALVAFGVGIRPKTFGDIIKRFFGQ